jgi:hypothetical protein
VRIMSQLIMIVAVGGFVGLSMPRTSAANPSAESVPVEIVHENGRFTGQLMVSLQGTARKSKVTWNGTIRNDSGHPIFRATFCINAFDSSDQPISPPDGQCVLRMWGTNWQAGAALNFKGKQDIRFGDEKTPIEAARFDIKPLEVF